MSNLANNLFNAMQQKAQQSNQQQQKIEQLLKDSQDKLHDALALIPSDTNLRRETLLALHHNSEAIDLVSEVNE